MRNLLIALFTLLLSIETVWATDSHHIELIIFRQAGVAPVYSSQQAPDNWHSGANGLQPEQFRSSLMDAVINQLNSSREYKILFHRAWQQDNSPGFTLISLSSGEEIFNHHPIEGTFKIRQDRANEIELDFWINQFQADGNLGKSEHFQQDAVIPYKELSFIDFGSLGALIRILPQ